MQKVMATVNKYKVDNKTIHVFDDGIDFAERQRMYLFLSESYYKIVGGAELSIESAKDKALQSIFSQNDVDNLGLLQVIPKEAKDIIKGYKVNRAYALLLNYSNVPYFHVDGGHDLTLLYYADTRWDINWGGETMFANKNLSEIAYTSVYKPGRVIIFDASIPHKPCTSIYGTPNYRLTFVVNLKRM